MSAPYYDFKMQEKSQSGGHLADPTMQQGTVGKWSGPISLTIQTNTPKQLIWQDGGWMKAQGCLLRLSVLYRLMGEMNDM